MRDDATDDVPLQSRKANKSEGDPSKLASVFAAARVTDDDNVWWRLFL